MTVDCEPVDPPAKPDVPLGWRYRCSRCDVMGYAVPDAACWCCDQTDQLGKATP